MKRSPIARKTRLKPRSDKRKASPKPQNPEPLAPLRANAEGQDCKLRLSQCRGLPEYVVLCHLRMFNVAGAGQKPPDPVAVFGCDLCHDMQEHHHPEATAEVILQALIETLAIQWRDGVLMAVTPED